MPQRSRKNWAPTTVAFFIKSHDEDGKAAASRSRQTAARSLRRLSPARVGMALPGFLAVGSALGAYLLAKVRAGGGAAKRRRVDPLGAFVDATEVPATPASSGDGAPRALESLRYAVKDIFQIEGRVTGFGSPAWAETHKPARKTARAVAMLADAGATCVGVTHMDEFAYGGTTLSISKKGSGLPEILDPCIDKLLETEKYYTICDKWDLTDSCFSNSYFPESRRLAETEQSEADDSAGESSSPRRRLGDYDIPTNEQAAGCSNGYCSCSDLPSR